MTSKANLLDHCGYSWLMLRSLKTKQQRIKFNHLWIVGCVKLFEKFGYFSWCAEVCHAATPLNPILNPLGCNVPLLYYLTPSNAKQFYF
jgi:hypothetical protein